MPPTQLHVATHLFLCCNWITISEGLDKVQVIGRPDAFACCQSDLADKPLEEMELFEFANEAVTAAHLQNLQMDFLIKADCFLLLGCFILFSETSQFRNLSIAGVMTGFANGLHLDCFTKGVFLLQQLAIDWAYSNPLTYRTFHQTGRLQSGESGNRKYLADLIRLCNLLLRQSRTGRKLARDNVIAKLFKQHD